MSDKQNIIEALDLEDFMDFLKTLFEALDFHNLRIIDDIILAEESGKLANINRAFYVTTSLLSGNIDIESLSNRLIEVKKKYDPSILTIVTNKNISNGFKTSINNFLANYTLEFLGRDELIPKFDKYAQDIWSHDDMQLLDYEKKFQERINEDNQLRILHLPQDKYERLLNIFISPSLEKIEENAPTHTFMRKRICMEDIINNSKSCIISGISGSGKSTILKNIGLQLIKQNSGSELNGKKKFLPIYVASTDILDSSLNIEETLKVQLSNVFGKDIKFREVADKYNIVVLVDSIDEFEEDTKKRIIKKLTNFISSRGIKFYLGTREADTSKDYIDGEKVQTVMLSKFNLEQIKRFINAFLPDNVKANDLLDSLRENKILERLPITPLTLSLISILYDENDYEVPATITDIYKNFNDLIVGRSVVSAKIEFIDVSFRERILSIYAYNLMKKVNHEPFTKEEFINYFCDYYDGKSLPIKNANLVEVLNYIIDNTGILYVKDRKWVCFSHDSYMEYYAAIEIFYYHRDQEKLLVDNFFDVMWQNVAVFYAGITKDMDQFALAIEKKLTKANRLVEFISGVQGAGYLLQALYQSDNKVRKQIVKTALDLVLETNEVFKKFSTFNNNLFRNYKLPIILALNFFHFYQMFNSLTLKEPLSLTFQDLQEEYEKIINGKADPNRLGAIGFKLIEIAFTMDSKRINDNKKLEYVISQDRLLKDPTLTALITLSFDLLGKDKYKELAKEVKRESVPIQPLLNKLISDPTGKVRFSLLDTVRPDRKVTIFVEGQTDVALLEQAYFVLTNGSSPYWTAKMATENGNTGSASAVGKAIEQAINYVNDDNLFIGMFDHDKAGLGEYRRLNRDYKEIEKDSIKQRINYNIYLLCIPVPGEMSQYVQEKQDFNFFEIEHYFGHDFLRSHNMISDKEVIPGVYEIRDSHKTNFAQEISKIEKPETFKYFKDLFLKIDSICDCKGQIDYVI